MVGERPEKKKKNFPVCSWLSLERRKGTFIFQETLLYSVPVVVIFTTYFPKLGVHILLLQWYLKLIHAVLGVLSIKDSQYIYFRSCITGFHYFCYQILCFSCQFLWGVSFLFEIFMNNNFLSLQVLTPNLTNPSDSGLYMTSSRKPSFMSKIKKGFSTSILYCYFITHTVSYICVILYWCVLFSVFDKL